MGFSEASLPLPLGWAFPGPAGHRPQRQGCFLLCTGTTPELGHLETRISGSPPKQGHYSRTLEIPPRQTTDNRAEVPAVTQNDQETLCSAHTPVSHISILPATPTVGAGQAGPRTPWDSACEPVTPPLCRPLGFLPKAGLCEDHTTI